MAFFLHLVVDSRLRIISLWTMLCDHEEQPLSICVLTYTLVLFLLLTRSIHIQAHSGQNMQKMLPSVSLAIVVPSYEKKKKVKNKTDQYYGRKGVRVSPMRGRQNEQPNTLQDEKHLNTTKQKPIELQPLPLPPTHVLTLHLPTALLGKLIPRICIDNI